MKYAPVIIPTLNRYEHLHKCIDSLKRNTDAINTDIYISIDYPPAEKYKEGYHKVLQYVDNELAGFKTVHLFRQSKNLGPFRNTYFLIDEVSKKHNTFIFTEDDNVFSGDFLSYINNCLEYFENSSNVFAICGYSYPIDWSAGKNMLNLCDSFFPAWGYATWVDKYRELTKIALTDIQEYLFKFSNAWKLYKSSKRLFIEAVQIMTEKHYLAINRSGQLEYIDCVVGIYLSMRDLSVVIPTNSRVMNIGSDGSGLHCDKDTKLVDDKEINDFISATRKFNLYFSSIDKKDKRKLDKYFKVLIKEKLKAWLLWLLYIRGFRFRKEK